MGKYGKFPAVLGELIDASGASLRELARQTDISFTTLSQYRAGTSQPTVPRLEALADHFGVSVDYLLGRTEVKSPDAAQGNTAKKETRMTLDDLVNRDFSHCRIEVWDEYPDEAECDEDGKTENSLFDFRSDSYRAIAFLLKEYAEAEVIAFYVLDEKTIRVVIKEKPT